MMLSRTLLLQVVCLGVLFAGGVMLDWNGAASLYLPFYLVLMPLGFSLSLPALLAGPRKTSLMILAVYTVALLGLRSVNFTAIKPFTRFYQAIRPGMSAEEVEHLLNVNFPADGKFKKPETFSEDASLLSVPARERQDYLPRNIDTIHFVLDVDEARSNARMIHIFLDQGKVVGSSFYPD